MIGSMRPRWYQIDVRPSSCLFQVVLNVIDNSMVICRLEVTVLDTWDEVDLYWSLLFISNLTAVHATKRHPGVKVGASW